jgi:hypothetical protein
MRGRFVSFAGMARAGRCFGLTLRMRMRDLIEECFESPGPVELKRAMQLLAAESAAALRRVTARMGERVGERLVKRIVERAAAICALCFARESIVMEPAAARFSEPLRASTHCASRAWTSASTNSSKTSCSSLRRFAAAFKRLSWKDSIEAADDMKRYSRARSMAPSRDAESWVASPLVSGIAEIDITQVITSYSTAAAVPDYQ